jgi:ribulose-5-phosphate 4-epimerase/fuculose-1-phosphate aldolase
MKLETNDDGGLYELKTRPNWRGLDFVLTPQQELACALRILARAGCNLDVAGHITVVADENDGSMWFNPWGIWWEEVRASDIIKVDKDGTQIMGQWDVTPAIFIHTELHRRRGSLAKIAVHNHPHYGVLLGTMGVTPKITDQQAVIFKDEVGFLNEYEGGVTGEAASIAFADGVGNNSAVLLANHGALVTAPSMAQAVYKTVTFERMCKLNYQALAAGVKPSIVPPNQQDEMKHVVNRYAAPVFWEGAVRQLLASEPEVLH